MARHYTCHEMSQKKSGKICHEGNKMSGARHDIKMAQHIFTHSNCTCGGRPRDVVIEALETTNKLDLILRILMSSYYFQGQVQSLK